ncbi:hypothetical protein, partial [Thermofilum sp.]|uniref:hypothetical protein n=1 Tax=Thermofilum sp. TaxID=1961369 RepID=UPI00258D125B
MEASLEYLAVGLLIVLLVLAAHEMMSTITSTSETTHEEQLYTIAERVMDKLILTPGYPVDWGTNIQVTPDTLQDFGLALYSAHMPYIVDPDKVMRLANLSTLPNPLLLNTTRLAQLLNLEGYGFRLRIRPMLIVNITPTDYYPYHTYRFMSRFEIAVSNYYGLGIPNANITAMYVVVQVQPGAGNNKGDVELKNIFTKTCLTDPVGRCTLDFTKDLQGFLKGQVKWFFPFLIVRAEWQGFVSVAGYGSTSTGEAPAQGYIIGNYVFLNRTIDITYINKGNKNAGAVLVKDDLLQAVPEYQDLLNFTTVTWCRDSSGNFRNDDPLCNNAG